MKTMKDYKKSDSIYFDDFFVPGDIVGEDVVENFRNVLPPTTDNCYLMQMGEPYSHINGKPTYMTFTNTTEGWKYCGNCFRGEKQNPFTQWFESFLEEKGFDLSEEFTSKNDDGISKTFNYQEIIENIKSAPEKEQDQIQDMLIKIDYRNGNIKDFLQHLSKALVTSKEEVERLENIYGESIGIEKEHINQYKKIKEKHQEEANRFPMYWAFGDNQWKDLLNKLNLTEEEAQEKLILGPAGSLMFKEDVSKFTKMMENHYNEIQNEISKDKDGTTFIKDMFIYELINHEYGYTRDLTDTLESLQITDKDLQDKENLRNGLELAIKEIKEYENKREELTEEDEDEPEM